MSYFSNCSAGYRLVQELEIMNHEPRWRIYRHCFVLFFLSHGYSTEWVTVLSSKSTRLSLHLQRMQRIYKKYITCMQTYTSLEDELLFSSGFSYFCTQPERWSIPIEQVFRSSTQISQVKFWWYLEIHLNTQVVTLHKCGKIAPLPESVTWQFKLVNNHSE